MTRIRLVGRARGGRCVFCHDGLQGDVERCPECRAAWHEDCRPTDGHCHTLGCTAPAPLPAGRGRGVHRAVEPPPSTRPVRPAPAWTTGRRRPGWLARLGPYSRLAMSALAHTTVLLAIMGLGLVALAHADQVWRTLLKGDHDGPNSPFVALLIILCCLVPALAAVAWCGAWLLRLPGVVGELHELLEQTTPVLMELSVEHESDDDSTTYYAHLRGRHGEYLGQNHRFRIGGLLPPWWLTAFTRIREPVLVYGLPPPGPYVIEFESGALALLHPD